MKNKGTSFGELIIVLLLISTALTIFLKISSDYIRSLVFAKEMFVLNSILQEKYQFLIAYRNKVLERDFATETIPEVQMPDFNFNCIEFNRVTNRFITSSASNCQIRLINGNILPFSYRISRNNLGNNIYKFNLRGTIRKWNLNLNLEGILTPWHPAIR